MQATTPRLKPLAFGVFLAVGFAHVPHALAQAVRPDAGSLLESTRPPAAAPALPKQILPKDAALPAGTQANTARVKVARFAIEGAKQVPTSEIEALLADLVGKELSFEELRAAATRVTQLYQARGAFLSRAVIPEQDVASGTVRLVVLEAKYGKVTIGGANVRLSQSRLDGTLAGAGVSTGSDIDRQQLERGLLLLDALPGIDVKAVLSPGSTVGAADINVTATEGKLFNGQVGVDTLGNRYTGRNRVSGGLTLNDLLGQGDQAILRGILASGSQYAKAGYSIPLGYSGLRVGVNASAFNYELCCGFSALQAKGTARAADINASYPIILNQTQSLYGSLTLGQRRLRDEALGVNIADKRITDWNGGLSWIRGDGLGGTNRLNANYSRGNVGLSGNAGFELADAATARTRGSYGKLMLDYTRLQPLATSHSLLFHVAAQSASKNLDTSEKMALGGYNGVRAYPQNEANGDDAFVATVEYAWALPVQVPGVLSLNAFFDAGRVRLNKSTWAGWQGLRTTLPNSYSLAGAGLGVTWNRAQDFSLTASIARQLGSNPGRNPDGTDVDGSRSRSRVWLVANKYF